MQSLNLAKKSKERIILATLEIIKKQGMAGVSIRKIVNLAKVNVAAVNYYFGSKDNIINEVIQCLMEKINKNFSILNDYGLSAEERLIKFLNCFVDHIMNCPEAFKGSMSRMIKGEDLPTELIENMKVNYQKLRGVIEELSGEKNDEIVTMKMFQLLSSVIYPLVIGEYANRLGNLDFKKQEVREKYISLVINSIK